MAKGPTPHTDPGGLFGAIGSLVGALLALGVAFGLELTPAQTGAILGVVAAAGPLVTAAAIRSKAWAPARHFAELERAFDRGRIVEHTAHTLEAGDETGR